MKLYLDLLTTLKVTHAESPIVIFFGTYGTTRDYDFFSRPPNNYLNETFYIYSLKASFKFIPLVGSSQ